MNNDNFESNVEMLENNPIFAMSLGEKELFHSNFWAWLIKLDIKREKPLGYANIFFQGVEGFRDVKREEKHRDISLHCGDGVYIIENKLKSAYDIEQLRKYQNGEGNFIKGCVTGIFEPNFLEKDEDGISKYWHFKSYEDIAKEIDKIAEKECGDLKVIINKYTESIRCLYNVLNAYLSENKEQLPHDIKNITDKLKELKIWDLCQKLSANIIVDKLEKDVVPILKDKLKSNNIDFDVYAHSAFTNGTAYTDVRFEKAEKVNDPKNKDIRKVNLGVQIQGSQFRINAQFYKKDLDIYKSNAKADYKNKQSADESIIFDIFEKLGWFKKGVKGKDIFGNEKFTYCDKTKSSSMSKERCKYNPKEYCFVYQYFNLESYDYENVKEEILKYMIQAIDVLKKIDRSLIDF